MSNVKIFSCRGSQYLAKKIVEPLNYSLGKSEVTVFSDGEFQPEYKENIRGCSVFIIQSTFTPSENWLELLMMIDAARRASAKKIIAVIPYFGFARQDRKDRPRVSIAAKLMANLLSAAGVDRIVTMDLHADQIQGFFDVPVDHLYASSIFAPYITENFNTDDLLFASPDAGGTRRVSTYSKMFGCGFAICYKQRSKPNVVESMQLIGDVEGKNVILLDDIIDTGNTIVKAANLIKERGAKSVRAMITHPLLTGNAYNNIESSQLEELIVSDTIPLKQEHGKIKVLSTAPVFAEVINRIENCASISDLYKF